MSVTPDFTGQRYKDTNTGNIWIANSTTPGDWTLELRNLDISWNPTTGDLSDKLGFICYDDFAGVTSIRFDQVSSLTGFDIESNSVIQNVEFPNLVTSSFFGVELVNMSALVSVSVPSLVGGLTTYIQIKNCPLLTSLAFPAYVGSVLDTLIIQNNTGITSIDLSLMVRVPDIHIKGNTLLTTIDLSSFVPGSGDDYDFTANALSETQVNSILAACVASAAFDDGSLLLDGGTNAAPTGQGVNDKATLIGRGVTVTTN